jgi:hypothetical protein
MTVAVSAAGSVGRQGAGLLAEQVPAGRRGARSCPRRQHACMAGRCHLAEPRIRAKLLVQ